MSGPETKEKQRASAGTCTLQRLTAAQHNRHLTDAPDPFLTRCFTSSTHCRLWVILMSSSFIHLSCLHHFCSTLNALSVCVLTQYLNLQHSDEQRHVLVKNEPDGHTQYEPMRRSDRSLRGLGSSHPISQSFILWLLIFFLQQTEYKECVCVGGAIIYCLFILTNVIKACVHFRSYELAFLFVLFECLFNKPGPQTRLDYDQLLCWLTGGCVQWAPSVRVGSNIHSPPI